MGPKRKRCDRHHLEPTPNRTALPHPIPSYLIFSYLRLPVNSCRTVLLYPVPSYHIPILPRPTRILNAILYPILIKYSYPILPCHIILKLNRNDPWPKRLGSVYPGRNDPNSLICTATMLKLFGLVYCRNAKKRLRRELTKKSEAVLAPFKI